MRRVLPLVWLTLLGTVVLSPAGLGARGARPWSTSMVGVIGDAAPAPHVIGSMRATAASVARSDRGPQPSFFGCLVAPGSAPFSSHAQVSAVELGRTSSFRAGRDILPYFPTGPPSPS